VKTAVWVRKPGPIAEVAMRNAAPTMAAASREGVRGGTGPGGLDTAGV
jgi:hypothetical protein